MSRSLQLINSMCCWDFLAAAEASAEEEKQEELASPVQEVPYAETGKAAIHVE